MVNGEWFDSDHRPYAIRVLIPPAPGSECPHQRRRPAGHGPGCVDHSTRARVRTPTSAAPARNNIRAQASTVAPVVKTSSTRRRRRPAISVPAVTANASRTFRRRASVSPCWGGVALRRQRLPRSTGSPCRWATARARTSAWLNPRRQRRAQWSGTGTSASHSPSARCFPASSARSLASRFSNGRRRPCFANKMAARATPSSR